MLDYKELSILEIKSRIAAKKDELLLVSFERTPVVAIEDEDMPAVLLHEGVDTVVKRSTRSSTGYPVARMAEIIIELVAKKLDDDRKPYPIKSRIRAIRNAIFEKGNQPVLDESTGKPVPSVYFQEARTEGPDGYGYKDVIGMRLVFELIYPDDIN